MGSEEVLGEAVTADNLESLLRRCAANLPGDYKPDSQSWGLAAAIQLLGRLRGSPLEAKGRRILAQFRSGGNADEVQLAKDVVGP